MEEEVKLDAEVWIRLKGKEEEKGWISLGSLEAERQAQGWSVNVLPSDSGQS